MKKIYSLLAALVMIAGVFLAGAAPASAATGTCTKNGTFRGTTSFHRESTNNQRIVFDWARVEYVTAGSGLEYRVRWYSVSGTTLIYDSGYSTTGGSSATVFPGVGRVMGSGSSVLINAGALFDGLATCDFWLTVP